MNKLDRSKLEQELDVIPKLLHPNILTVQAVYIDPHHHCLVMDYMNDGSVSKFL